VGSGQAGAGVGVSAIGDAAGALRAAAWAERRWNAGAIVPAQDAARRHPATLVDALPGQEIPWWMSCPSARGSRVPRLSLARAAAGACGCGAQRRRGLADHKLVQRALSV
jgi:hypothetical protein